MYNIIIKNIFRKSIAVAAGFIFLISSCKKKDNGDCPNCPCVTYINPTHAHAYDYDTIHGKNFSSDPHANLVKINGILVSSDSIISGDATTIIIKVPKGCGTGALTVDIDQELTNNCSPPTFTYDYRQVISVFAGSPGVRGDSPDGVSLDSTKFDNPVQVAVDNLENVFVLDQGNLKVRKLDGVMNQSFTIYGSGNPTSIATDENNICYISDYSTSTSTSSINKITPGATSASLFFLDGDLNREHVSLTSDSAGHFYISRQITNLSKPGFDIIHYPPFYLNIYQSMGGNVLYYRNGFVFELRTDFSLLVTDSKLSKFSKSDTTETILLDYGSGLNNPAGLVVAKNGDIYIADTGNNKITKVTSSTKTDLLTNLSSPRGMAIDKYGNIFFAESGIHCIKKISFE